MAGKDDRRGGEREQLGADAGNQLRPVAADIRAADRTGKQDVAAEDERRAELVAEEDHRAGTVTGNLADLECQTRDREPFTLVDEAVGGRARDGNPERRAEIGVGVDQQPRFVGAR